MFSWEISSLTSTESLWENSSVATISAATLKSNFFIFTIIGLIALQSYLNHVFKDEVEGKLIKSRIDFDSYEELNELIKNFNPDLIGVSSMTFHKDFFHDAIAKIRECGYQKTLIVGGPHPTTSYEEVLKDDNIDICAIGEGEQILAEVVDRLIKNNGKKLNSNQLKLIDGIAFTESKTQILNTEIKPKELAENLSL